MQGHIHQSTVEQLTLMLPFLLLIGVYIFAGVFSNQRHKAWPLHRYFFWIFGVFSAAGAVVGPIADRAHMDFTAHMTGHLLLGMLAPLLIAISAPITLILRTLSVKWSRRLTRVLKSRFFQVVSDPAVAALLNVGGLWLLYTTDLFSAMHDSLVLHVSVHLHVFLAGYLFTVSMIYMDPTPHHRSFQYRGVVLILALGGHAILSKYLYSHPPAGVPSGQAEVGAMIMYYGGDVIDIVLITIFCFQWYKAARPRTKSMCQPQLN
ncbi:cytochrome c oxidase assembly protein [Pseudalkalibacillus sp. A8]|uniref:cytochrome c oxidase assembly protein n=1 Tax=Pseudalkalibacillus sp. A8 TaxID=3382641 RepID=UPI0038B63A77